MQRAKKGPNKTPKQPHPQPHPQPEPQPRPQPRPILYKPHHRITEVKVELIIEVTRKAIMLNRRVHSEATRKFCLLVFNNLNLPQN
jgi:hypothetical protein